MIPLPGNPYPCDEVETVSIGKTPYARFDLNDYSVPHTYVRKSLTIHATLDSVSILDGSEVIATHVRSYDKAKQIECAEHVQTLVDRKRDARQHRGQDRLTQTIDCARDFLKKAALDGYALRTINKQLVELLNDYGSVMLEKAMAKALASGSAHPNTVRLNLDRLRAELQQAPVIPTSFSSNKKINETTVRSHSLSDYGTPTIPAIKKEKK